MLVPNKMQHVICTGNVGLEQFQKLRTLAPNIHVVAGEYDDPSLGLPETSVVQVGQFRIGIIHGHQLLPYHSIEAQARMRRKLGVDIMITGHTHRHHVFVHDDSYFINPVSDR